MKSIIEVHPFGVVFKMPMPLSVMGNAAKIAAVILDCPEKRLVSGAILDRRVGGYVITTKDGLLRWLSELDALPIPVVSGIPWLDEWIDRGEVGQSSATLAAFYGRVNIRRIVSGEGCAPRDADDFRRCYLFLELAAKNGHDWRVEPGTGHPPEFARIAGRWDRLTELYLCGDYQAIYQILSDGK